MRERNASIALTSIHQTSLRSNLFARTIVTNSGMINIEWRADALEQKKWRMIIRHFLFKPFNNYAGTALLDCSALFSFLSKSSTIGAAMKIDE
jgi:hypothetical protein